MNVLKIIAVTTVAVLSTTAVSMPVMAATAHNSQAGAFGASSNPGDTTVNSRRVKHAAKHAALAPSGEDRDAGMYIVKPHAEPEYTSHAAGSDGSVPPE